MSLIRFASCKGNLAFCHTHIFLLCAVVVGEDGTFWESAENKQECSERESFLRAARIREMLSYLRTMGIKAGPKHRCTECVVGPDGRSSY